MKKTLLLLLVCSISAGLVAQKVKTGTPPVVKTAESDIPPLPKEPAKAKFDPPVIVNDKGYDLSVHYINGANIIYAEKKGVIEKIPMTKWNANQSSYEKRYGVLPPPPPPPPPPAVRTGVAQ